MKKQRSGLKKNGEPRKVTQYLCVSSGPQRGKYVHDLIAEAVLGRELEGDETVEHKDGNGLNVGLDNLVVVTKGVNTTLRWIREQRARARENGQGEIPWQNQF